MGTAGPCTVLAGHTGHARSKPVRPQVPGPPGLRDRSLFMARGGPGSNEFLQENFSRPTHCVMENFRGPLDTA